MYIETPGIIKIGRGKNILETDVWTTAFSAHFFEIPMSFPSPSYILMPLFISPILMQYVLRNPADATAM